MYNGASRGRTENRWNNWASKKHKENSKDLNVYSSSIYTYTYIIYIYICIRCSIVLIANKWIANFANCQFLVHGLNTLSFDFSGIYLRISASGSIEFGQNYSERTRQNVNFELKTNPSHGLGADFGIFVGLWVVYCELPTSPATVSNHTIEHGT